MKDTAHSLTLASSTEKGSASSVRAPSSPEEMAQWVMEEQGHIVVAGHKEASIKQVLPGLNNVLGRLHHPTVVVGEATASEFIAQIERFYPKSLPEPRRLIDIQRYRYFYKVIAE